jgi:hypothetical protein
MLAEFFSKTLLLLFKTKKEEKFGVFFSTAALEPGAGGVLS